MTRSKHPSLAQSQRNELIARVHQRGKKASNIWYLYCPGSRADIVLIGDAQFELFLAIEGDPDVREACYEVPDVHIRVDGTNRAVHFDVLVTRADGRSEYCDVHERALGQSDEPTQLDLLGLKCAAAASAGAKYVEITFNDLDALRQRTKNWARAIAALARCRDHNLAILEMEIASRVANCRELTIGKLLSALHDESPALVVGATVGLLRKRQIASDLDTAQWGTNTRIWACQGDDR